MCGVAGWFAGAERGSAAEGTERLRAMLAAIAHRGPDDRGERFDGPAALGHVRLSIIDPAGGSQPMTDPGTGTTVVHNGEIYNFRVLRGELEARGRRFRTASDTEVLLALHAEHGWPAFARLRGMYAFALWDARARCGWLVRDPLGIKPLFAHHGGDGTLTFASEAKAILAAGAVAPSLAEDALHLAMNFRYLPGTRSLFRGIEQVAPGEVIEWRPGEPLRRHRLPDTDPPEPADRDDLLERLRGSVSAHLESDVPVGAYLSGGVDSALVVALAGQAGNAPVPTFTLDVGDDPREAPNAARSAALLGVTNRQAGSAPVTRERLARLVWHLELPKVNALQVNDVARLAASEVKVALSGLGGDELYLGYNAHRIFHLAAGVERRIPSRLRAVAARLGGQIAHGLPGPVWRESGRAFSMLAALGDWPRVYGLLRNVWDNPPLRRFVYGPRMLDADLPDAFETIDARWPRDATPLGAMADFETEEKMVNDLLWQEDRASMAEGLEVRVPFVDRSLVAHARGLPIEKRMPGGRRKALLLDAARAALPPEILARPKSGFQVAAPAFFTAHLASIADDVLSDTALRAHGLFNPDFVHHVRRRPPRAGLRWHYFMLYLMLMSHLWLESFEQRTTPAGASPGCSG